jgi:hypothetical protein
MKKEIRNGLVISMLALVMGLVPHAARASVPHALTQQGRLFDTNGKPISGKVDVTFAIYDKPTAATSDALWTEPQSIQFDDGWFSVALGETKPMGDTVLNGEPRWIGIKVGMDDEMTPRAAIRSVPYALIAENATGDITPKSVSIAGIGKVIDENGKWVGDPTGLVGPEGAMGPAGQQGPAGPAEDAVFRGSFPVINEPFEVTQTVFAGVGPIGLDLAGAVGEVPPAMPGRVRMIRFRTLYGDNLSGNLCNPYASEWQLARHDQPNTVFHSWTLDGTWAGGTVHRMAVSSFLPFSAINNGSCDSGFENGSCRIYARLLPACNGGIVTVRSITIEVYDFAP